MVKDLYEWMRSDCFAITVCSVSGSLNNFCIVSDSKLF